MSKFGELISAPVPVLIDFFTEWSESSKAMDGVIEEVAMAMGEQAKVIKIDADKNRELAEALRVKQYPTLMVYKDNQMVWRQSGEIDVDSLKQVIQNFAS